MVRERLPSKRTTVHYDVDLAGSNGRLKLHLSCGSYPDGRLGEIAIAHGKAGAIVRTMLTVWAHTASVALQSGVPIENILRLLRDVQDATGGKITLPEVPEVHGKTCSSLWDGIAMILQAEFA